MRHRKMLAAVGVMLGVLAVLYVLGAAARTSWDTLTDSVDTIRVVDDYVISGEQFGDLAVFARTITVAADGFVLGSATLVGDRVEMGGRVTGDFSATASQIVFGEFAHIDGSAALAGDRVLINGIIQGEIIINASSVILDEASLLGADVRVCAQTVDDRRAGAEPLLPCTAVASSQAGAPDMFISALWPLAMVLAGGALAMLPHVAAPLRLGRLDEGLRGHKLRRGAYGVALAGLWLLAGLLLAALPGGFITTLLLIAFLGASFVFGALLVWLGASLASLWLGLSLARLVQRPRWPAPLAALIGGLIISGALALAGPASLAGLLILGALAVIGLAALSAARASGAAGSSVRGDGSYFVQG